MEPTIEAPSHTLVAAVKRLNHAPRGSNAEMAAAQDALLQLEAIRDGISDRLMQSTRMYPNQGSPE